MKKTGLLIITILLTLTGAGHAFASDTIFTEGLLQYKVEEADDGGKQISITRYYGDDENFQVPWSIGLLEVRRIENGAFAESPVVRVMLPDNDVEVEPDAFREDQKCSAYRIGEEFHFEDGDEDDDDHGAELTDVGDPEGSIDPPNPIIWDSEPVNPGIKDEARITSAEQGESGITIEQSGNGITIEQSGNGSTIEQSGNGSSGSGSGTGNSSSAGGSFAKGTVIADSLKVADADSIDISGVENTGQPGASEFVEFEIDIPEDEWEDTISAEEVERIKAKKDEKSGPEQQDSPKAGDTDVINGTPDAGRSVGSQPEKKTGLPVWLIATLVVASLGAVAAWRMQHKAEKDDGKQHGKKDRK